MSIEQYYKEISRYKLLTEEETNELVAKVVKGDKDAAKKLTEHNLRLVVPIARLYAKNGIDIDDLVQVGNMGLMTAIERFDPTKGTKLSTFAFQWIRTYMQRYVERHSRVVKLPSNIFRTVARLKKTTTILQNKFMREPSAKELADALEWDEETVITYQILAKDVVSLQLKPSNINDDHQVTTCDWEHNFADKQEDIKVAKREDYSQIEQMLQVLPEKHREIIKMHYGIGGYDKMSYPEIAEEMGVTKQRIEQIVNRGINKMGSVFKDV